MRTIGYGDIKRLFDLPEPIRAIMTNRTTYHPSLGEVIHSQAIHPALWDFHNAERGSQALDVETDFRNALFEAIADNNIHAKLAALNYVDPTSMTPLSPEELGVPIPILPD